MSFEAKYKSRCGDCGESILPGDVVRWDESDEDRPRVVHVECDPAPVEREQAPVCPECWLLLPCGCGSF